MLRDAPLLRGISVFGFSTAEVKSWVECLLGLDDVGELEYHVGDGENYVDLLMRRSRIALEVDATVNRLIGWNRDRLQMRGCCCEFDCFLHGSLSGCIQFVEL